MWWIVVMLIFAMTDHSDSHNDNVGVFRDTLAEGWGNYWHSLSS